MNSGCAKTVHCSDKTQLMDINIGLKLRLIYFAAVSISLGSIVDN